jgi:hypothetical protein
VSAAVFWLYLANLTLLVLHEMDSAYWREWDLFRLRGGIAGFLLFHLPLWPLALWGLVQAWEKTMTGSVLSLVIAAAGLITFTVHTWFLSCGRPEFDAPVSKGIIRACLPASLAQAAVTVAAMLL